MSEMITPVVYEVGLGAIGGFIVGFALKKIAKVFVVIIGLFVLELFYLGISGVININYNAFWTVVVNGIMGCRDTCASSVHRQLRGRFPARVQNRVSEII